MKFEFLSPQNVKPSGWLLRQLEAQASGLNGNLDVVWKDVRDSKWIGGTEEGWERLPYFLDGFIPLAYLLDDKDKKARARRYVNFILEGQQESGRFCPKGEEDKANDDIWSQFLILKVLTVYADCAKDKRVEEAVYKGLRFLHGYIQYTPPYNWAQARWFEALIPLLWMLRRRPEEWMYTLARRLKTHGLDYEDAIPTWEKKEPVWTYDTHVVNISMALKSEALFLEVFKGKNTRLAERMLEALKRVHGTAYGHFTGDECLSGNSPSQGSELCGVVEAMYSYEWLTALTGEAKWAESLQDLAFNGLPATVSEDTWTHQYVQQVNQIACTTIEPSPFPTNGPQANMFGLEPHFGCCTANFGQGWPKFALSAYMKKRGGFVCLAPVPCTVKSRGTTLTCESEYPFRNKFSFTADKDTSVTLLIPAWAEISCKEGSVKNGWLTFSLSAGEKVELEYRTAPRFESRPEGRVCLKYGALLFSLPIPYQKRAIEYVKDGVERKFPYCDYDILPTGEWKYAFAGDTGAIEECEYTLPFSRENPPLKIKAKFYPVEWECKTPFVCSPNAGDKKTGNVVELEMQPYGTTYLRMTEMKKIDGSND